MTHVKYALTPALCPFDSTGRSVVTHVFFRGLFWHVLWGWQMRVGSVVTHVFFRCLFWHVLWGWQMRVGTYIEEIIIQSHIRSDVHVTTPSPSNVCFPTFWIITHQLN
jgi:hypothetical protein